MQNGVDFNSTSGTKYNYNLTDFNGVFRFGITEPFEVGLGLNYISEKKELNNLPSSSMSGLSSFSLRIRSNVYQGKGLIPSVGYQFNLALPYVSEIYQPDHVAPKITIITSQSITQKLGLATNFGFAWNGVSSNPKGFYIVNLGYSINNKWSVFVENYGTEENNQLNSKFDGGVAYLMNNDLQLDVFGGYDQSNNVKEWFVSVGFSWRIRLKKDLAE